MATSVNEAYSVFAKVYDDFMEDVPYDEWADFLIKYLADKGVRDGLVLDLGCGSGEILSLLKEHGGFDMIGLDSSEEMLRIARDKEPDALYLCQDMRSFELYGTVNAIVSVCDSINYITEKEELLGLFKLANNYLEAGGYFIFDLNTIYKYKYELADNTFAEDREDKAFIWDNFFDEESGINEYLLTLFIGEDGVFKKATIMNLRNGRWSNGREFVSGNIAPGCEIVLNAKDVAKPVKVRYLFNRPWKGTVFNESNLPLGPFLGEVGDAH